MRTQLVMIRESSKLARPTQRAETFDFDPLQLQVWEWEGGNCDRSNESDRCRPRQESISSETEETAILRADIASTKSVEHCALLIALDRDVELISEAVRRLIQGTCCLQDEDRVSAFELYSQVKAAMENHIHIEDRIHLALLDQQLGTEYVARRAQLMSAEHRKIELLLRWTDRELKDGSGETFRISLGLLLDTFHRHHHDLLPPAPCCHGNVLPHLNSKLVAPFLQRTSELFLH